MCGAGRLLGGRGSLFEKSSAKTLNELQRFSLCRQSASDLVAVTYGVGLFGLNSGVPAKRVVV